MDVCCYLAKEGIERRIDGAEFERLASSVGGEGKKELDDNLNGFDCNPNKNIKLHYDLLGKYGLLDRFYGILFDEMVIHMPQITNKIRGYARVLDAGCSSALKLAYYAQECPESDFLGIDRSLESVAWAEQRIDRKRLGNAQVKLLDICDVEKLSSIFDCVIATNVLHENCVPYFDSYSMHYKQDIASGLCHLSDMLISGGRFIFTLHFFEHSGKDYIFDNEIYPGLKNAGLEIEEESDIVFNHFDRQTINGLWVCRKK